MSDHSGADFTSAHKRARENLGASLASTLDDRVGGFQVQPANLTGYCKVCGALLGDIATHLTWHDNQACGSSSKEES